jgi:DNA-directed RNA polymerase specialized sigma24 family protein
MWQAVFAFAGDPEVASDAVAEAFAQALRRGDAIRSPECWLWRTVFRIAAGELKARWHVGSACSLSTRGIKECIRTSCQ